MSEELTPRLILQPHTLLSWNLRCWNPPKYCGSHRREGERHEVSLRDARRGRGQSRGSPLLPPRDPTGLSRLGLPVLHGPPIRRSVGPHLLLALLHRHRDRSQSETSINPSALRPSSLALPPPCCKNQKINFSIPKSLRESRSNQGSSGGKPSSKSGKRGAAPREETDKTVTMASVARSLRKFLGEIQHVKVRPRDRAHEGAPWRGRTSRNSPPSEDSTITHLPRQEGAVACREGQSFSCGWLRLVIILIGVIVPPLPPAAVVPSPAHFV